ncbi:MAG: SDR family NAD(P)-dependent oxidoreductase [Spirochaetaceae bacterium]|nr:MAG: SDR family NAD(P)-dependent oxidoreductase [Spirochaetaceae bacterium]
MNPFRDSLACVTGGSSGIGLAIARRLAVHGARIVLIARTPERLSAARADIVSLVPDASVNTVPLDVTDQAAVRQAAADIAAQWGDPRFLFNCAGDALPGRFDRYSGQDLRRMIAVNLEGTWNMTQAFVDALRHTGGHVVNVSSLAGLVGTTGYTAYAASKFAVVGFSEALRNELAADGVRVSVLCPGDTDTPQLAAEQEHKPPETAALSARARVLSPDQVANACLRGVRRGRFLILAGGEAQLIVWLKRFAPGILFRSMDRVVLRARQGTRSAP